MRKKVLEMVYELAKKDKRIFYIGSDLGAGTLNQFKEEMPGRFFMEGICDWNGCGACI
jgi:transketolase